MRRIAGKLTTLTERVHNLRQSHERVEAGFDRERGRLARPDIRTEHDIAGAVVVCAEDREQRQGQIELLRTRLPARHVQREPRSLKCSVAFFQRVTLGAQGGDIEFQQHDDAREVYRVQGDLLFDHATVAGGNPRVVTCAISGFGSDGPGADLPGYDLLVQAMAGWMAVTGDPDGPPTKVGFALADVLTGQQAGLPEPDTALRYPGKVLADEASGRLYITDSNHNRIVVTQLDGTLVETIGSGDIGAEDGDYAKATFDHPQGLALAKDSLYVADTENPLLRKVDLKKKQVTTVAGTGQQARPNFDEFIEGGGPGRLEDGTVILEHIGRALGADPAFAGRHMVVTAGPTREAQHWPSSRSATPAATGAVMHIFAASHPAFGPGFA